MMMMMIRLLMLLFPRSFSFGSSEHVSLNEDHPSTPADKISRHCDGRLSSFIFFELVSILNLTSEMIGNSDAIKARLN